MIFSFNDTVENCMDESKNKEDDYCPVCAGTGEGQHDGARCWVCKGKGILKNKKGNDDES